MRSILIAGMPLIAIFAASTVLASPINLTCSLADSEGKSPVHIEVTLNEDAGTAGIVIDETGLSTQNMKAAFLPASIAFSDGGGLATDYRIDRVSSTMTETMSVGPTSIRRAGACIVAPKINRQF